MKNEYWNIVLTAGFVLGVLYAAQGFLSYVFYGNMLMGWLTSILGFAAIIWVLVYYGRKAAEIKDVDGVGYTYGQAFGFSLLVLLLSGVIVGFSQWLLQAVIDPEFYAIIYRETTEKMLSMMKNPTDEQITAMKQSVQRMQDMWYVIGASMFSMCMLGGLVALGTSAVVKRRPSL